MIFLGVRTLKIKKILNNNVVLSENKDAHEVVVMGKGLAFQKKIGEAIDTHKIEKVFTSRNNVFSEHFSQLMSEVAPEYIELASEIIEDSKAYIDEPLNDNIYIALVDHISFMISRFKLGHKVKNALLWETKKFYPNEYKAGCHALEILEKHFEISLAEDEAGFIALHLVNAQQAAGNMGVTSRVAEVLHTVIGIVQFHYGIVLDDTSLNYARFITHLQFFVRRVIQSDVVENDEAFLYDELSYKYPKAYTCVKKVEAGLVEIYGMEMRKSEQVYLLLHIYRVAEKKI